jgi:hypothetical protein
VSFKAAQRLLSAILATPFDGRFAVYCSKGWVEVRDKAHPEARKAGRSPSHARQAKRRSEYPPAKACSQPGSLRRRGAAAAYPVPQDEMIANVSALEAIFARAASGKSRSDE